MANQDSSKPVSRKTLALIVPITKLAGNHFNLHSWLSELPDADIEVFLVHDVQDDETSIILSGILAQLSDPRIRYLEGKFGAPGTTRNFAMPHIVSEWFWFVDADDLPKVHLVLSELDKVEPNYEVVVGEYEVINQFSNFLQMTSSTNSDLSRVAHNPGIWRMIFRSKVFKDFRFRDFRMAEDQIFLLDIDFFEREIKFSRISFYSYFKHNFGQLTSDISTILELKSTIPVVIEKLETSTKIQRHYLEIMLARQMSTEFKSANWSNRSRIARLDCNLIGNLSIRTQFHVYTELFRIFTKGLVTY